jgi:hypothetical protein
MCVNINKVTLLKFMRSQIVPLLQVRLHLEFSLWEKEEDFLLLCIAVCFFRRFLTKILYILLSIEVSISTIHGRLNSIRGKSHPKQIRRDLFAFACNDVQRATRYAFE